MAYFGLIAQRRHYAKAGTSSTINLLGPTISRTTSDGSTPGATRMSRIPSVAPSISDKAGVLSFLYFHFIVDILTGANHLVVLVLTFTRSESLGLRTFSQSSRER
jgi:hypothetical protein